MIYVDSSVVLAALLEERAGPAEDFWLTADLVTCRLTQFEVFNRLHAYRRRGEVLAEATEMLAWMEMVELTSANLSRALEPFPVPVRTLDGLHLAAMECGRGAGVALELASYDTRLLRAAAALGISARQL